MVTIIGVDPHKATHTAAAVCGDEHEVAQVTVRATCHQVSKLLSWAAPFENARGPSNRPVDLDILGPAARRCRRMRARCSAHFGGESTSS